MPRRIGYSRNILRRHTVPPIARKFADANIALLTGASGLNVVDIDAPELLRPMQRRFGETPLIVETAGRGGFQLYYRASPDVRAADLRRTEGLAVEIKAGGNIVIAPPSRSPITGRDYRCMEGRFDRATLAALPKLDFPDVFRSGSLSDHRRIVEGHRNDVLFSICLRAAPVYLSWRHHTVDALWAFYSVVDYFATDITNQRLRALQFAPARGV